jgi:hypothetical protein
MTTIEKKEPPSISDVNAFLTNIDFELPKGFIEFFSQSNGAVIRGKNVYVELWPITSMIEFNKNYKSDEYAPGFFIFGSNGGGTAYFFEKKTGYIYEREFIAMPADASFICKSFTEFLENQRALG